MLIRTTLLGFCFLTISSAFGQLQTQKAYTHRSNVFNQGGATTNAFDNSTKRIYSTNEAKMRVDVINLRRRTPFLEATIPLASYVASVNSVAASNGVVVVAGNAGLPQSPGKLLFFDSVGNFQSQITAGAMPDMVTFSSDGRFVVAANEGAPSDDYSNDPRGSISVIELGPNGAQFLTQQDHKLISFEKLDTLDLLDEKVRIFGNDTNQSPSQDLEPEHLTLDEANTTAYVSLQENNAIAVVNYFTQELDTVLPLGYKKHFMAGNGLDPSDQGNSVNIRTYNSLYGMFQPDGVHTFRTGGKRYILSANEGEPRDYTAYSEITDINQLILDPRDFPNLANILADSLLGRLQITNTMGDTTGDGIVNRLYAFGGRSFSVWDSTGNLVWDSGDEFEQTIAQVASANFNSENNDNNSFKARGDERGPEPTCITSGIVDGKRYAFIGLEQMSGVMIYDLSNPSQPVFDSYLLNRDFSVAADDPDAGDLGIEDITFVPKNQSPFGVAFIAVSGKVSGTVSIYLLGNKIGLKEYPAAAENSFYPNPAESFIHYSGEPSELRVFSMDGKLVRKVSHAEKVSLEGLKSGYYLVKNAEGVSLKILKK